MNLILQAVKSLFRKLENAIQQTATALGKRIDKAQETADTAKKNAATAQTAADNAQTAADNAQTTADGKMDAANPVGTGSFSLGRENDSDIGDYSCAMGYGVVANEAYLNVIGKHNVYDSSQYNGIQRTGYMRKDTYDSHTTWYFASSINIGDDGTITLINPVTLASASAAMSKYTFRSSSADTSGKNVFYTEFVSGSKLTLREYSARPRTTAPGKYVHVVGTGTSDTKRSNAHTLDWNGVPWYQGRPQFGGTAQDNGSQTVMANGDTEIILASSTTDSTKKFKITVDDSGTLTATEVT